MKKPTSVMLMLVSALYILNPTAGIFELLPDTLPGIGNIDEAFAVYVFFSAISLYRGGKFTIPLRRN